MRFALRLSHSRREDVMATDGPRGIVTLVCLTCGKEKFFTNEVPAAVSCEQCGSTVFRTFATPTEPDEAAIDALEAQARSMAYGDSSPDTTPTDVQDLDLR
jgi:DNA-directed RNA polymerase subunit RPC12/RpoP